MTQNVQYSGKSEFLFLLRLGLCLAVYLKEKVEMEISVCDGNLGLFCMRGLEK